MQSQHPTDFNTVSTLLIPQAASFQILIHISSHTKVYVLMLIWLTVSVRNAHSARR